MEVNKEILSAFNCPSCNTVMHPPIKMCTLGHCFCDWCCKQNSLCPLCKSEKSMARNYSLEQLYESFLFRCENESEGCVFVGEGSVTKDHELYCNYTLIDCPLKPVRCAWTGPVRDLFDHTLENHPGNTYNMDHDAKPIDMCTHFSPGIFYQVVIRAYSETFLFMCTVNSKMKAIKWALLYLGSKENAEKFYYTIEFADPSDPSNAVCLKSSCQLLRNYCQGENVKCEILADSELFKQILKIQHYHYTVTVKKH